MAPPFTDNPICPKFANWDFGSTPIFRKTTCRESFSCIREWSKKRRRLISHKQSMKTKLFNKDELESIGRIVETLNLYQVLKISSLASEAEVRDAFHREATLFHPDRYFSVNDPEIQNHTRKIYARVVEAYRTLSSRTKREEYDRKS